MSRSNLLFPLLAPRVRGGGSAFSTALLLAGTLTACVTVPKDSGDIDDSGGPAADATCLSAAALEVLGEFVSSTAVDNAILAGHASAGESVGYLDVPGWQAAGPTFFSLMMPCADAVEFDAWCDPDTGVCWQLACTAPGPAWTQAAWLDGTPTTHGGWTYADGGAVTTWDEASDALVAELDASAVAEDGTDYTVESVTTLDGTIVLIEQSYPMLVPGSVTELHAQMDIGGTDHTGEITVDGVVVATLVPRGEVFGFEADGACAD